MSHELVWLIAALTISLILIRPKKLPEAIWAVCGALLLMAFKLISPREALAAVSRGGQLRLPISNPANLVVYGSKMPPLGTWLRSFGLPSLVSIVVTFVVLLICCNRDLNERIESEVEKTSLSPAGKRAA
jgi:Na+/H+ antiporter NhaD/arsenite permease-like protein